ncbi:MAG: hypothetical protein K8H84_08515 [Sulfuricella denitrificans]|nr:hypothetical protein [Sulfuricella denitrificans]
MTPNRNTFVLIILLTLLQCFAPLLHAHTLGAGQGGGVHLYDVSRSHVGGMDAVHTQVMSAFDDESPAIGMAHEYRQDSAMLLSDVAQPLLLQSPPVSACHEQFPLVSHDAALPGGSSGHFIPFSQAPPPALI